MDEISMTVPEEPPRMSVVLDEENWAWQRVSNSWVRCGEPFSFAPTLGTRNWTELLTRGPVRVIHRGTPD